MTYVAFRAPMVFSHMVTYDTASYLLDSTILASFGIVDAFDKG